MAFYEHRLPVDVEKNAVGGPRFQTTVLSSDSGVEQRNIDWSARRGQWELVGRFMLRVDASMRSDLQDLIDLFHVQQGKAHGFRFKDHADFEIGDFDNPTTDNQSIGTGDGIKTVYTIFKRYTFGVINYDRPITRIVSGKVAVLEDNVVQADPGDYSINLNTGTITFVSAPAGSVDVQVALEFDVPVRFDIDHLETLLTWPNASQGSFPSVPIVELRE